MLLAYGLRYLAEVDPVEEVCDAQQWQGLAVEEVTPDPQVRFSGFVFEFNFVTVDELLIANLLARANEQK